MQNDVLAASFFDIFLMLIKRSRPDDLDFTTSKRYGRYLEASIEPSAPPAPIVQRNLTSGRESHLVHGILSVQDFLHALFELTTVFLFPQQPHPCLTSSDVFHDFSRTSAHHIQPVFNDGCLTNTWFPTRTVLFFVRRLMIWYAAYFVSRPTTGSILPSRANSVKSRAVV